MFFCLFFMQRSSVLLFASLLLLWWLLSHAKQLLPRIVISPCSRLLQPFYRLGLRSCNTNSMVVHVCEPMLSSIIAAQSSLFVPFKCLCIRLCETGTVT